jgi:hypothetical protein
MSRATIKTAAVALSDDEKIELLVKYSRQGFSLLDLSAMLRRSPEFITSVLAEIASVPEASLKTVLQLHEDGLKLEEISAVCRVPVELLQRILLKQTLPRDTINQVFYLRNERRSLVEISQMRGMSINCVQDIILFAKKPITLPLSSRKAAIGSLSLPNGDEYEGELLNGRPHGMGMMKYKGESKMTYDGDWVNGKTRGYGVIFAPLKTRCHALFRSNGLAIITQCTGKRYEGEIKAGCFEGQGTLWFNDGSKYTGSFKSDRTHGYGVLKMANGGRYEGHSIASSAEGQGIARNADGIEFAGLFKAGKLHGYAVVKFPNGERHEGHFTANQCEGQGAHWYADGKEYAGLWKAGSFHGFGVLKLTDGVSFTSQWIMGKMAED